MTPSKTFGRGKPYLFVFGRGGACSSRAFPTGVAGTALAVDEEKVSVKLTTNKVRIAQNTSSV